MNVRETIGGRGLFAHGPSIQLSLLHCTSAIVRITLAILTIIGGARNSLAAFVACESDGLGFFERTLARKLAPPRRRGMRWIVAANASEEKAKA
jgi:hypothetical protein